MIRRGGGGRREREREREEFVEKEAVVAEDEGGDRDRDIRLHRDAYGNLQLERKVPARRSKSSRRRPTQRDVNAALFALT